MTAILSEVCEHVAGLLEEPVTADDRLFSAGRLSSLQLMMSVEWAQKRFGVEVLPEDLSLANFDTPRRFAGYLARRLDQRANERQDDGG